MLKYTDFKFSSFFLFFFSDPPGPPTIKVFPRVLALELTWNSSVQDVNNIKILDYRIKVLDGAIVKQEFPVITRTPLTIEKLARNRTYFIEIQARNEVGYGETAKTSAATLLVGKVFFHIVATYALTYSQPVELRTSMQNNHKYKIWSSDSTFKQSKKEINHTAVK